MNFINFESIPSEMEGKVKQNLKFKTGKFIWRVKFTAPLDPATINNMNLYVTDTSNRPLKTAVHYNPQTNEIEIEPLESYAKDSSYILNISKRVRSVGGQTLKSDMSVQFRV